MSVRSTLLAVPLALCLCSAAFAGPAAPKAPAKPSTMTLDLTTGKTDSTLLQGDELALTPNPTSPPQTVEGTLKSVDPNWQWIEIHTLDNGDVKVGMPANTPITHNGQQSTHDDLKVGDNVFATVTLSADGSRALHVVSDTPMNPLVNYIGIPVLLLIALAIYMTGRTKGRAATVPVAKTA